ncbi:MAG: GYD domain-containing protein [Anaerolineae bacterium]|nr:GYD domain-containing protein [Anaerolineae bacterium]
MTKYFVQGNYTAEGVKRLIKDGGTGRRESASQLFASAGGSLECLYFSSVGPSYYIIIDIPDKESAMAIAATGVVNGTITIDQVVELLTPAEMDEAVKKTPMYHSPG